MLIVGLDFETSGIDPAQDRVIEVGAVLWDMDTKQPLAIVSDLVHADCEVSEEITGITGITKDQLTKYGVFSPIALVKLHGLMGHAHFVMAHFGSEFDRLFHDAWCVRERFTSPDVNWLDSAIDIAYPPHIKTRNLRHLAAEHNFLNSFSHRAVFDVLTMLRIASLYDMEAIIKRAAEPTLYVEAVVSFERKDMAKDRGYKWFGPRKIWWKSFKASDLEVEKTECGFPLRQLIGNPEKF